MCLFIISLAGSLFAKLLCASVRCLKKECLHGYLRVARSYTGAYFSVCLLVCEIKLVSLSEIFINVNVLRKS